LTSIRDLALFNKRFSPMIRSSREFF
jgi:hypothetical protein